MEGTKVMAGVRKAKKKQVKDEFDRIKQAEKKKRRLEKALAASAAIRSELEKKKQKNKEEQERLDKEGAATAEAVALHVLLGEDSDDITYNKDEGPTSLDHASNMGPYQDLSNHSLANMEQVPNANRYEHVWDHWGNSNLMMPYDPLGADFYPQYFGGEGLGMVGFSAGHLAAQAVSSLKIADDALMDAFVLNCILHG